MAGEEKRFLGRRFRHAQWTATEDADWLTLDAVAGEAPGTLTVTGDPTQTAAGDRLAAEITLAGYDKDDNETDVVTIPVTLAAGNVWFSDESAGVTRTTFLPLLARP